MPHNQPFATIDGAPDLPFDFAKVSDSARAIPSLTRGPKLLWVDDSNILLSLYKSVFENMGFAVSAISSPVEALKGASLATADVAILDYEMPEMNGIELARRIKTRHPRLPVILYSGCSSIPARAKRSVDAICMKGAQRGELLNTIERLVCECQHSLNASHPPTFAPSSNHYQNH